MTEKVLLSARGVCQYFPLPRRSLFSKGRTLKANENIHLDIYEGETYGLVGESGSGKSTFGRTLLQLYPPTKGQVTYYGGGRAVELTSCKGKQMRALRKQLQMIFQDPYSSLNPRMTAGQAIGEGVALHGFYKKGSKELDEYVLEIMKKCGLEEYAVGRYPHQFSGGQRQRICIARALAVKPKFVVCDECVSALDASIQSQILNLLTELKEEERLTYLFISHDLSVVRYISDRIGVMYLGQLVEWGGSEQVFDRSAHPYTQALVSAIPGREGKKIILSGSLPSAVEPPSGCPFRTRCFMAKEICKEEEPPLVEVEKGHFCRCHFVK